MSPRGVSPKARTSQAPLPVRRRNAHGSGGRRRSPGLGVAGRTENHGARRRDGAPGGLFPPGAAGTSQGRWGPAPCLRFASLSQRLRGCDPQKDCSPKAAYPPPVPCRRRAAWGPRALQSRPGSRAQAPRSFPPGPRGRPRRQGLWVPKPEGAPEHAWVSAREIPRGPRASEPKPARTAEAKAPRHLRKVAASPLGGSGWGIRCLRAELFGAVLERPGGDTLGAKGPDAAFPGR